MRPFVSTTTIMTMAPYPSQVPMRLTCVCKTCDYLAHEISVIIGAFVSSAYQIHGVVSLPKRSSIFQGSNTQSIPLPNFIAQSLHVCILNVIIALSTSPSLCAVRDFLGHNGPLLHHDSFIDQHQISYPSILHLQSFQFPGSPKFILDYPA